MTGEKRLAKNKPFQRAIVADTEIPCLTLYNTKHVKKFTAVSGGKKS